MEALEKGGELLEQLKDPQLVWDFQRTFGVRKVVRQGGAKSDGWTSVKEGGSEKTSEQQKNSANDDHPNTNVVFYKTTNRLWHFLFLVGSQLGDEELLGLYFMIWMWCLDSAVGRKVVLVWTLVMYIGQGLKDMIRWPRPEMPVVVQIEKKWALEYGMPSTHAMVGLAVPAASIFFTFNRFDYNLGPWLGAAAFWCLLVCCSRLYLGMHSVADIMVGLLLTPPLLFIMLPLVDHFDRPLVTSPWAPILPLVFAMFAIRHYPGSDRWTPARGDTTASIGVTVGVQLAHQLSFHLGLMCHRAGPVPFPILWPSSTKTSLILLLRIIVGFFVFLVTRAIGKPIAHSAACFFLQKDPKKVMEQERDVANWEKLAAELTHKFFTYMACGFNTVLLVPAILWLLGVGRIGCWTDW